MGARDLWCYNIGAHTLDACIQDAYNIWAYGHVPTGCGILLATYMVAYTCGGPAIWALQPGVPGVREPAGNLSGWLQYVGLQC